MRPRSVNQPLAGDFPGELSAALDPDGSIQSASDSIHDQFPDLARNPDHPIRTSVTNAYDYLTNNNAEQVLRTIQVGGETYKQYILPADDEDLLYTHLIAIGHQSVASVPDPIQNPTTSFYQQILDELPTEVVALDPQGRYRYINPAAVSDPETREWLIGRTNLDYARHRDLNIEPFRERHERIRNVAESKQRARYVESFIGRDGQEHHYIRIIHPVTDENDEVRYLIGYGLDITDQKRIQEELREAKKEAERASQVKSALLSHLSHDVRTPLTSMIGFADVLTEEPDANQEEMASMIARSGRRLMRTLDTLLSYSALESREIELDHCRVNLDEEVRETVDILEPQASEAGVDLSLDGSEAPVHVRGDRDAVGRVAANLIQNAIKFAEGAKVRVNVWRHDDRGCFEVEDTGPGMPEETIDTIFDPFAQQEVEGSSDSGGVGLGLAITRELVDRMDGQIEVDSTEGQGTRFTVCLQLLQ